MLTRKKIRTFVEDNRNDLLGAGSVLLGCTMLTALGYSAGNRHARRGWRVTSAQFDQYIPELEKYAVLHVAHRNKKVTNLRFNLMQ